MFEDAGYRPIIIYILFKKKKKFPYFQWIDYLLYPITIFVTDIWQSLLHPFETLRVPEILESSQERCKQPGLNSPAQSRGFEWLLW